MARRYTLPLLMFMVYYFPPYPIYFYNALKPGFSHVSLKNSNSNFKRTQTKILQTVCCYVIIVCYYCMLLLYVIIVCYYCMLLLYVIIVCYYCMLLLFVISVCY